MTIKPHRSHGVILLPRGDIWIGVAVRAFDRAVGLCFLLDEETKASSKRHHLVTESVWPEAVELNIQPCSRKEILNTAEATDIMV